MSDRLSPELHAFVEAALRHAEARRDYAKIGGQSQAKEARRAQIAFDRAAAALHESHEGRYVLPDPEDQP